METITINKSTVALLRGLNMTKEEMATKLGISKQELAEGMIRFGFAKSTKELKRTIVWNNDIVDNTPTPVAPLADEPVYENRGELLEAEDSVVNN